MRKVDVVTYNEDWVRQFQQEAAQLRRVFGNELIDIHHIGSTSVPGLKAKPVIDIMPVVSHIDRVGEFNMQMIAIGYEPMGENGLPERRFFRKGGDKRTHHVHVFQAGNENIERHLAFRDYLRTHSEIARKYGDLKEELARKFPYDIEAYINGKDVLVKEIEQAALTWYRLPRV